MVVRPKIMFLNICKFHLQFWQMCKLFANKLFSLNTYFYSSVWIIMVHSNFDAKNLHFICLRISPQIFAIVQKFALDNFRDQQFRNLLCEWEWVVMVVFTGNAVQVEVPPDMVWNIILISIFHFYLKLNNFRFIWEWETSESSMKSNATNNSNLDGEVLNGQIQGILR